MGRVKDAIGNVFCSWSGGKDSALALQEMVGAGADPGLLLTMMIEDGERSRSHGLARPLLEAQSAAMRLPIHFAATSWDRYTETMVAAITQRGAKRGLLTRLVEHFEQHVAEPRPLDASPEVAADAHRDSRGTIGLRLVPTRIVAKRKMSQNKSPEIVETVLGELEGAGPYASADLAREMRLVHGSPE